MSVESKAKALEGLLGKTPPDPFACGDVIKWNRTYGRSNKTYNYAAIKTDEGYWYLTGKTLDPMTLVELAEDHLIHADKGSILIAQDFEPVEF